MSWPEVQIGTLVDKNLASIQTGPFGTQLKASDYVDSGIPVINVRNVGYSNLRPEKLEYVTETMANRLFVHIIKQNDIVFGRKGAVDRHLFVQEGQEGWLQGSDCIRLRLSTDAVNPRFVSYAFLRSFHKQWMLVQSGNKATMASLNQDVIKRILLPLPKRSVQDNIVDVLSSYDDLIENNRRRIELLEESARQLYKEWFVRFRFPGHEHVKIIDGVPEGWKYKRLIDVANLTMGQSPKSEFYNPEEDGLPFHQGVTNYGIRFVKHETWCTKPTRIAEAGDILFSVRAPVGRLNVTLDKLILGRGLAAIRSKMGFQSFLFYQLKSVFFKEDMIGGGAIYASVTKKDLENQGLLVADNFLTKQFEEFASDIDSQIKALHLSNKMLVQARDLLLPKLMNGEIVA